MASVNSQTVSVTLKQFVPFPLNWFLPLPRTGQLSNLFYNRKSAVFKVRNGKLQNIKRCCD